MMLDLWLFHTEEGRWRPNDPPTEERSFWMPPYLRVMKSTLLMALGLVLIAVNPVALKSTTLESQHDAARSHTLEVNFSATSGWTSGGEALTLLGSGFRSLADRNITYDGINHAWATSTADYASHSGPENAIVVDSNGFVHVVYINGENFRVMHAVFDGTGWNTRLVDTCAGQYCWDAHMVIDDLDELHVAYAANNNKIVYQHFDGVDWTGTVVSSTAAFAPVGIDLDSNRLPHISYAGAGQYCGGGLRLASFNGTDWNSQHVDQGTNKGCDSSIVIDGNDRVYIAYQDRQNEALKFATNTSGSWISYTPEASEFGNSMQPGYATSLAMDEEGRFHIAHYDSDNDDLRYSTGVPNGQWSNTAVDTGGNTGRNPSIALDAAGDVHVVYASWAGFDLKYAKLNTTSNTWQKSSVQTQDMVGDSNSIFIDSNGTMHVAYSDDTNDVLLYATKATGVTVTDEITVRFGNVGAVTGDVIDDETIRVSTPTATAPVVVNMSVIDQHGVEHLLSLTFEFIDQNDLDGDGVVNSDDDCPNVAGTSNQDQTGCPDDDGDGYSNTGDTFPNDVGEWEDSDGDGVGDNADAFPNNGFETLDSDGDGVGDNADAFPNDPSETTDTDGDGVGDNADVFPLNAFEQLDADGDGVGDNTDAFPNDPTETIDSDGDGVGDNADAFPNDASETSDRDGDGVGDNADAFPDNANETVDADGDGVGDNADQCLESEPGATVSENGCPVVTDSDGDGVDDVDDACPDENASVADENNDGCLDDDDGDGVLNTRDDCPDTPAQQDVNDVGCSGTQLDALDDDQDGVMNADDRCPNTLANLTVDDEGCLLDTGTDEDTASSSFMASVFSGENGPVTTTVGIGAVLLALFGLLQTNAAAAVLPDAFRWAQVLRRNSKLTKEEENELTYLQSVTQAYHTQPLELAEELHKLQGDLTARYTNNGISKQTREKLMTLIDDLLAASPDQLRRIAHNDAYFGLAGTIDTDVRTQLLNERLAMTSMAGAPSMATAFMPSVSAPDAAHGHHGPPITTSGEVRPDGYEWLEWPHGSRQWYYRQANARTVWTKWE